ncbi:MAG TPA: peptidase M28, partial [Candidatus Tenderia sp.]|nr:peptidase M28 [Candidatus Tenderia sp.]
MMWIKGIVGVCLLVLGGSVMAAAPLHHHLQVTLQPAEQRLDVVDTVTFPRRGRFEFYLSAGLQLQVEGASLVSLAEEKSRGLRRYAVTLASAGDVVFRYSGSLPQGSISPEGVVLEGGTLWYPFFPEHYLTFDLSVTMPPGWRAVSQGRRLSRQYSETATQVVWQAPDPQEEIYLIAARFSEYEEMIGPVTAMAFLRQPDAALARRYLDVTAHYL